MATTLEIVNGISQVLANTYDGALDENGEPVKIGLKREEGHPILDSRVMDGFKVRFHGNQMCIHYHSEIKLKDIYSGRLEEDVEAMIDQIAQFLKKEYKKVTGKTLSLTAEGETKVIASNTSKIRVFVQAHRFYNIGGMEGTDPVKGESTDSVDAKFKSFLDQGGWDKNNAEAKGQPVYAGKGKVQSRKDINSPFKAE
jgi:hypothetical protein